VTARIIQSAFPLSIYGEGVRGRGKYIRIFAKGGVLRYNKRIENVAPQGVYPTLGHGNHSSSEVLVTMNNDSKKTVPFQSASQKRAARRRLLNVIMATYVMPRLAALLKDAARDYAGEIGDDPLQPDPFTVDACAGEIIAEVIEFLWQCQFDSGEMPVIHIRQMKKRYFNVWWGVE